MNYRIIGLLLAAALGSAQTKPSFEVVSIKPSNPAGDRRPFYSIRPGGGFMAVNATVIALIQSAYGGINDFQISGGAGWMSSERFDINAKPEGAYNQDQFGLLLQSLLAERFHLVVRRETREMPVYALVADRNGPKFKTANDSAPNLIDLGGATNPRAGRQPVMRLRAGLMIAQDVTMSTFAFQLSKVLDRSVADKTGLTGKYDFRLDWTPDENQTANFRTRGVADREDPPTAPGPSLFTALQEQLGLRLASEKGPVEMLVIERIERPSEN